MAGVNAKPRKNGKYQGWYQDERGRQKNFIGTRSKTATRDIAKRLEDRARPARLGLMDATPLQSAKLPIAGLIDQYLAWGKVAGGRGRRPWSETHCRMRVTHMRFWRERIGTRLSDLSAALPAVEKALTELQADGKKRKTISNYAEAISSFCDFLLKRDYIITDPLKRLSKIDVTPERHRHALAAAEIRKLLEGAAPQRRLLYEVAFSSGLRANELRQLDEVDLDTARGGIRLKPDWTKNRKAGFQPLHPDTVGRLKAASGHAKAYYARVSRHHPIKRRLPANPLLYVPSHTARDLEKDLIKVGIDKVQPDGSIVDFHACRAAYITMVGEATHVVKELQSLARHADVNLTVGVYAKAGNDRLKEVATAVADNFLSTTAPGKKASAIGGTTMEAAGIEPADRLKRSKKAGDLLKACRKYIESETTSESPIKIDRSISLTDAESRAPGDALARLAINPATPPTTTEEDMTIKPVMTVHLKDGKFHRGYVSDFIIGGKTFLKIINDEWGEEILVNPDTVSTLAPMVRKAKIEVKK